jgi:signal transduction histidine kinase
MFQGLSSSPSRIPLTNVTSGSVLLPPESKPHDRLRQWVFLACGAWLLFSVMPYLPPLAPHRWPAQPKLLVFSVVALGQTALLFAAARRRVLGRRLRQAIALIAAGMLLVAVSDALTALLSVSREGPALQSVNDVLELAYNLLGLGGLLWLPLAPLRRDGRWLVALDIAVAVGGMVVVLFLTTTLTDVSAADPGQRSRIFQYGLIAAGNLVALNLILVRGLARPVARAVSFLAATVVIEIGYWVVVQMALAKLITDRRPIDVLFGLDQVCYALAGLAFLTARVEPGRQPLTPTWMRELNPLPAVAIIAVGVMLIELVLSGTTSGLAPGVIALVTLSLLMVVRVMLAARDRARLVRLELETEQRLLAGRARAVKRLAGGIAHEFNNQIAVIIGTAEMEMAGTPGTNASPEGLDEIRKAGQRVADLTAHLLAYAGDSSSARETVPA